jgi:hypothetical protein
LLTDTLSPTGSYVKQIFFTRIWFSAGFGTGPSDSGPAFIALFRSLHLPASHATIPDVYSWGRLSFRGGDAMKKRWLLLAIFLILLPSAAVWMDPTRVLWGTLRGEAFYDGRPTSFWRSHVLQWDQTEKATRPLSWVAQLKEYLGWRGSAGRPAVLKGDAAALPVLRDLLLDLDSSVRQQAFDAVATTKPDFQPAVPVLTEALHNADIIVRWHAAQILLRKRPEEARETIPILLEMLQDGDVYYRERVAGLAGSRWANEVARLELEHFHDVASQELMRIDPEAARRAGIPCPAE